MKNSKLLSQRVALGLLLNAAYFLVGQPAQAQIGAQNGSRRVTFSPEGLAAMAQAGQLNHDAAMALHAGRYAEAEALERQSIAICPFRTGVPDEVLAEALETQGKEKEALQTCKIMADRGDISPSSLLSYALLLLKSGHWKQALVVYDQALPHLPSVGPHLETPVVQDGEVMLSNSHFLPDVPEPTALATAIHVARGLVYNASSDWAGESQNTEAMAEYGKALQLAPDSPLVNYYYGVGWQKLSPAERAKSGSEQQAKAALRKAVLLGKGDVKKAALKALKGFNKPP